MPDNEETEHRHTTMVGGAAGPDRAIAAMEEPIREARADDDRFRHLPFLEPVSLGDCAQLERKDREYGGSWKKRGGVGVFMMLARKWDRLENMVDELRTYKPRQDNVSVRPDFVAGPYDLFSHAIGGELEAEKGERMLDTLGDLRRYCLLAEAEIRYRMGQTPDQARQIISEAN